MDRRSGRKLSGSARRSSKQTQMRFTQLLKASNCRDQGMPEEALKWSWAAFLGGWIWLFFHRRWVLGAAFLLYLIVVCRYLPDSAYYSAEPFSSFLFFMFLFGPIFPWIFAGIYGLRLAWSNGCWQNVDHIRQQLKVWVGWLLLGAPVLVAVQFTILGGAFVESGLILFWTDLLFWIVKLAIWIPLMFMMGRLSFHCRRLIGKQSHGALLRTVRFISIRTRNTTHVLWMSSIGARTKKDKSLPRTHPAFENA
jgi:hypothetical protein